MQEATQICKISWTEAWKPCWKRCEEFQSRTVYCAVEYSSTNEFWNKLGSLVAKFCKAGCTSTIFIFKLLQTRTAFRRFRRRKNFITVDPYSYWTTAILLSWRCWVTCKCPALDSLLDSFYSVGGVVSHLQGFPTFRVLASTRGQVPKYICPHKAEVSKRQY